MAGVSDDVLGEAICACVVSDEGVIVTGQEIIDWCAVMLAGYKVPDLVHFCGQVSVDGNRTDPTSGVLTQGSGDARVLQDMKDCRAL